MATVLLTWELGSGLGHMELLRPVGAGLTVRGHRVLIALKNLAFAGKIFAGIDLQFLSAPTRYGSLPGDAESIATYPQLLHSAGFGDQGELATLVAAWRTLYDYVHPDVIVANFSPVAMLAARGMPAKVVNIGSGFECPIPGQPFPDWRPELGSDPAALQEVEDQILANANAVLAKNGQPPLDIIVDLYRDVDATILRTYAELDPFSPRPGADYLGIWPDPPGQLPHWPAGAGARVFAYLRPLPGIRNLLSMLRAKGGPTILRMPNAPDDLLRDFSSPNLHWERNFLDMDATLRECDLGICHASLVMSAAMLHAGKPILMFPPYLEQGLTAMSIARRHAGILSTLEDPQHFEAAFDTLVNDRTYTASADEFARKYPSECRQARVDEAVERVLRLLS
jgi:UDP:flavonoid glycosyltransferase YjiC (YdhE family)